MKPAAGRSGKNEMMPVYLCYGKETYAMREFVKRLTEQAVALEYADVAVSRFDLTETEIGAVLEDAETLPFLAPRKVVIAENALLFTASRESPEHDTERLLEYIQSPAEYTVLVFTVAAEKLDQRKKAVKKLKEMNCLVEFPAMNHAELVQWITARCQEAGCRISADAAEQIIVNAGAELSLIAPELDKLCTFAGNGGMIDREAVNELVSVNAEQNVFALIDEIVRLQAGQAMSRFYELLKRREEPVKILMLLARQFRIMLQAKELSAAGFGEREIAAELNLHPFSVKMALQQGKTFSQQTLSRVLAELAELDYRMKSGKTDKIYALERFLLKLAHMRKH